MERTYYDTAAERRTGMTRDQIITIGDFLEMKDQFLTELKKC